MKIFKLSSIALLFVCIISCTKSSNTPDQQTSSSRAGGGPSAISDVSPSLIVNFNPSPGIANQPVTVTGTFDQTTGIAIPDCGKLQLFQNIDGNWVKQADADVSATVHEVSFQFTPTLVGDDVYEFRVHYIASACAGFQTTFSNNYFLDVVSACNGLTISGSATASPAGTGMYDFMVSYTVNTCGIEYTHLKTQGGLTAWSTDVSNTSAGAEYWETGNSSHPNTVIKWEENSSLAGNTRTYSVTFKKAWSGSGPVTLTGDWSVKADINGSEVATATCSPIIYQ
jgi:hypothetical protein